MTWLRIVEKARMGRSFRLLPPHSLHGPWDSLPRKNEPLDLLSCEALGDKFIRSRAGAYWINDTERRHFHGH